MSGQSSKLAMGAALSVVRSLLNYVSPAATSALARSAQLFTDSLVQAVAVVPLLGVGFATGLRVKDDVNGWYKRLNKPSWTPPGWVFGPVSVTPACVADDESCDRLH